MSRKLVKMDDVNPLAKSYARLVQAGRRTIESVPAELIDSVKKILAAGAQ